MELTLTIRFPHSSVNVLWSITLFPWHFQTYTSCVVSNVHIVLFLDIDYYWELKEWFSYLSKLKSFFLHTEARDGYLEESQYHLMLCMSRISVEDVSLKITIICYKVLILWQHCFNCFVYFNLLNLTTIYGSYCHHYPYCASNETPATEDKKLAEGHTAGKGLN